MTSELNTTAEIAQDMWCREKPSTSCGEQFTSFGALPVGGHNVHDFSNLYLAEDHTYDLAFEFW